MKRIIVSGGTGFIGKALVRRLVARGDEVTIWTRGESAAGNPRLVTWDPSREGDWGRVVDGADAVVNLAGETAVGVRYTDETKRRIRDSRVITTRHIVDAIQRAQRKPEVFVSASAVGYYGLRGASEPVDESAGPGSDFLAQVCVEWEAAAEAVTALGVRLVNPRIGIVFGAGGGALSVMALPFKLLVGGRIGSGEQGLSWVHLDDAVSILLRAIDDPSLVGKVNVTAPAPATNAHVSDLLGKILHRPSWLPAPSFALKLLFGDGAKTILGGQFALPRALERAGFVFQYPRLEPALRQALSPAKS